MLKAAVCDDEIAEFKARFDILLKRALARSQIQAEITYYSSGLALLEEFKQQNIYDVVILDIDMPEINGKELARKLRAIDSDFTLAFFSAYEKEVFSTIPIGISAFVPKNFEDEEILSALEELFTAVNSKTSKYELFDVLINGIASTVKLQTKNIYYFQFDRGAVTVHTYNAKFTLIEKTFDKIVKNYLDDGFFKISRTCVINISKVYEMLDGGVIMDNGDKLIVSRRVKKELFRRVTMLPAIVEVK